MSNDSSLTQTTSKSKAQASLERLLYEHWKLLNACHICGKTAGIHHKLDPVTLKTTEKIIILYNCQHSVADKRHLKACNFCLSQAKDIKAKRLSKLEKKRRKKEKIRNLRAAGDERYFK